jgi:Icc-related predicted phosphoesterase
MREIASWFTALNLPLTRPPDNTVISFSHFLPRIDVMPHYIPERHRIVYPVLGSDALEQQVRLLRSNIHVYGHSHVNRHIEIDGVTYINNAFGYPSETRIAAKRLLCIYG